MKKIVVTGVGGFIASNLVRRLNSAGHENIVVVDDFMQKEKQQYLPGLTYSETVLRQMFPAWIDKNPDEIRFVFHLGARTDTTSTDVQLLDELNVMFSQEVWQRCVAYQIPLVYASSAATYGDGAQGFSDDHTLISSLRPLNPYGDSKQEFDLFALAEKAKPRFWAGLKFFNVYGPYEFHKKRMASVALHAYAQIKKHGKVKLFKSHRDDFHDGEQLRDFIYVDDVVDVCVWLMENYKQVDGGIYNLGTGGARTFNDLVNAVFTSMNKPSEIEYIPIPEDIRANYQYFTEAKMEKLRNAGYTAPFTSLEEGVRKYVEFLEPA